MPAKTRKQARRFVPLLLLVGIGLVARSGAQGRDVVAFEGVSVIPMDRERVLARQTVMVRDGRIAEIGSAESVRVPAGATRVDGRDKFLIPALAEMHAHLPGDDASDQVIERLLFMHVANGIGTIRGIQLTIPGKPGEPPQLLDERRAAHGQRLLTLRDRAARGELLSPATIYLAAPPMRGDTVPTADVAAKWVAEQKAAGYDTIKILDGVRVRRDVFDAMALEAHKLRLPFSGHVPADVGLARALEARYSIIDHLDGYMKALARPDAAAAQGGAAQGFGVNLTRHIDLSRLPSLVAETKAAGTWMVATQILSESQFGPDRPEMMAKWPEMRYADPKEVGQWIAQKKKAVEEYSAEQRNEFITLRRRVIKSLHDAGVGFLSGSDAPQVWNVPGFSAHRELGTYVVAGLTPYQALATSTRNVATYLGTLSQTGTVEVGKRANLVLLEGNPLQDISNTSKIAGVMMSGRWLTKSEIARRLRDGK